MFIKRYLKEESIDLDLGANLDIPPAEEFRERDLWDLKELLVERLVGLLVPSGQVVKPNRLTQDLLFRERKATTALGHGIAIPHVRTNQARGFAMAMGIAPGGVPFGALDGDPVEIFICMVAPPHDDRQYLKAYKAIGAVFEADPQATREALVNATVPGEVIRLMADL